MSTARSQKRSKIDSIVDELDHQTADHPHPSELAASEAIALRLTFGEKVYACRVERKWSKDELAQRAGINPLYLGQIELGKRDCSISVASRICGAFEVPLGQMLGSRHDELSEVAKMVAWNFEEIAPDLCATLLRLLSIANNRGMKAAEKRSRRKTKPKSAPDSNAAPWKTASPSMAKRR